MPSRYFEGNAQPEHHSNVEDFYHQVYFETVDTVANCHIVSINRITPCMQTVSRFFPKELWGNLSHTEFDSDNLRIQLSILAESYHNFRQGEAWLIYCIMSLISSK